MLKCPKCGHKLYGEQGKNRCCKNCSYVNYPNYKTKENGKQYNTTSIQNK